MLNVAIVIGIPLSTQAVAVFLYVLHEWGFL
jgi:hypothetical protein